MKRIGTDKEDQGNDFVEIELTFDNEDGDDDAADDKTERQQ